MSKVSKANGSVVVVRTYPGIGRLKGKVCFSKGDRPEAKESEIIKYVPTKESLEDKPDEDKKQTDD